MNSKKVKLYIGILLSIIILFTIFYIIDLKLFIKILLSYNYFYVIMLCIPFPILMYIRTIRWNLIINNSYQVKTKSLYFANSIGFMLNYLLPFKAGEFSRAELLNKEYKIPRSFSLGTIFLERILDAGALLIFLIISLVMSTKVKAIIFEGYNIIYIIILILILSGILIFKSSIFSSFKKFFEKRKKLRIVSIIDNFSKSLNIVKTNKKFFLVLLLSFGLWGLISVIYYLVMLTLSIGLPIYVSMFVVSMAAFGMIIPSSPGNVGVFHGVTMGALLIFYPNKEEAFAFSVISHFIDFVPSVILGVISFLKIRI